MDRQPNEASSSTSAATKPKADKASDPRNPLLRLTAFFDEATNTVSYLVADPATRAAAIVDSGATLIALLALSDSGTPSYDATHAAALAGIGVPAFACTPDLFGDLMAAAIERRDLTQWAAANDIVTARFDYSFSWFALIVMAVLVIGYFVLVVRLSDKEYREVIA